MNEEKKRDPQPESSDKKDEGAKKEGGNNKPLFFGVIAGVIIVNTIIAFLLVQMTQPKKVEELNAKAQADSLKSAAEARENIGEIFPAVPIEVLVNVAGTDGERFLKAAIQLEVETKDKTGESSDKGEKKEGGSELDKWIPKFRDVLLDHLSKLTLIEVTEPDAKEKIRKDLVRLLNNVMPPKLGEIKEVLFTEYIIQ